MKRGSVRLTTDFDRVSRKDLAKYVFRVSPQTVSKWSLKEDMPRNEDGTFSIGDCLEWFIDRAAQAGASKDEVDESSVGSRGILMEGGGEISG
ncbi:MAG: hypothetical protein AB1898_30520 [Acidobacteriota bacterium]